MKIMIIERHLRIGNYVARNDSKEFIVSEVLGINRNFEWEYLIDSRNSDGRHRESLWISATKCDPIPLTPEWLERCGFVKEDGVNLRDIYVKGQIRLRDCGAYELINDINVRLFNVNIGYLHQLQNLYFALTGEELNVKL